LEFYPKLNITQDIPYLKVVCYSWIHPCVTYSTLISGRSSNATNQPLIKLQNKAVKLIRPANNTSLELFDIQGVFEK